MFVSINLLCILLTKSCHRVLVFLIIILILIFILVTILLLSIVLITLSILLFAEGEISFVVKRRGNIPNNSITVVRLVAKI